MRAAAVKDKQGEKSRTTIVIQPGNGVTVEKK